MAKALEGIRVLDCTVWFQGPVSSQYLADFGAACAASRPSRSATGTSTSW
ncbi:MAG: CoA transferase [Deltaproteobacteria bacterium]|nr:CoA transferase [Deltaproteobacteria bacterium]